MWCKASFFGGKELPCIDVSRDTLEESARQSTGLGLTVPGVQKKLPLHLSDDGSSRLTIVGHPAGYILKPQTEEFDQLPEAEDLVMDIAQKMGVRTVPHGLIDLNGSPAYITRRVDRENRDMLAMEDFCQLSGRLSQDKYRGSYERCGSIIRKHSSLVGFDLSEFFLRLVVSFVTGNSDMHLKNFSLVEQHPGRRDFVLSPAYDLLPVNAVMPEDTEETALTLNGKKSNLQRQDFLALADSIGLGSKPAERMIASAVSHETDAIRMCEDSLLNPELKSSLIEIMKERTRRLSN